MRPRKRTGRFQIQFLAARHRYDERPGIRADPGHRTAGPVHPQRLHRLSGGLRRLQRRFQLPQRDEWEGDSWDDWDGGWNWDDWDGGGGDNDEEEIVAGGGGAYPDEGVKSAVYVELVDAETDRPIQEENIRFELYRTDITHLQEGSLQILNTYYPEKISYRLYATREDGTFYLPEKIWQGNYYFHELNAPEGYDLAADTYFDVNELFDLARALCGADPPVPGKNIIRIQMNDADTQLPVGGGTFWVIAAENIITMDGTVRYTTGQVVDTIYCDEEGYGESDELYLGAYTVQQVGAPRVLRLEDRDLHRRGGAKDRRAAPRCTRWRPKRPRSCCTWRMSCTPTRTSAERASPSPTSAPASPSS